MPCGFGGGLFALAALGFSLCPLGRFFGGALCGSRLFLGQAFVAFANGVEAACVVGRIDDFPVLCSARNATFSSDETGILVRIFAAEHQQNRVGVGSAYGCFLRSREQKHAERNRVEGDGDAKSGG